MHKIHSLVLDARMIHHSGIGVYIRNLIPYLNKAFDLSLIGPSKKLESLGCKIVDCDTPVYSPKELYAVSVKVGKCDAFWTPHFNFPLWPVQSKIKLSTIHDLYHLAHFEQLSLVQKIYTKTVLHNTVSVVDKIFTVSDFTKNEIVKYYPNLNKSKIETIHIGVDTSHFACCYDLDELEKVRVKYELPTKYILFVGNLKQNKNALGLVKAMQELRSTSSLSEFRLVIVGKKDGFRIGDNEVVDYINKNKLTDLVHFTGFVEDDELPKLYSMASLFVFPSLYEGFGLPPLEAMACGIPVLCSNMASMPEVCGEAAFYFNPEIPNDLTRNLKNLLLNNELRKSKLALGQAQIQKYKWEVSAEKHIRVISDLLLTH